MERILKQTIEGIALDTKNLARLADALESDNGDRAAVAEPKDGEILRIDDEACTMVPFGDTTTRSFYCSRSFPPISLLIDCRLFRRIFILELCNANQKSH
jgi:hypothetical protein